MATETEILNQDTGTDDSDFPPTLEITHSGRPSRRRLIIAPIRKILKNMFGLDYRSLALLRMGLAVLSLCNLYASAVNLRVFFTDDGVLPRTLLLNNYGNVFSLHMAGGSVGFAVALLGIQAVLSLLMLLGYRTRLVTVASFVLLCSMQARNPLLIFGVDIALRVCFFWAMFLPLGRRFSLDVALGRERPPDNDTYLGIPGIAYLVQFASIYVFSGLFKTGYTWQVEHTAIYYALSTHFLQKPLGAWLSQYDSLTGWLTVFTLYIEKYGTLLFILPVWSKWGRLLGFAMFAAFQIIINITMQMGLFGPVMIGVMLVFLPSVFWTHLIEPVGKWSVRNLKRLPSLFWRQHPISSGSLRWVRFVRVLPGVMRDGVVVVLIVYVVISNVDTIPGHSRLMPTRYSWVGLDLGLDQMFNLFAPDPDTNDGWFVIQGDLENGKMVNALTGEPSISYEKPADVFNAYIDQRWSAYLLCLWSSTCAQHLEPFSLYLGREWNRTHSGPERMTAVHITFMHEYVGPNHTRVPAVQELLWTQTFN